MINRVASGTGHRFSGKKTCGQWFYAEIHFGAMDHARPGIADENSGKLAASVQQEPKRLAKELLIQLTQK
ncbi:MAG: hypothetical protein JRF29_08800 [Deltaproteobacteria bacterium]|jgi:hypothetical protein|nr:hypothetical protein [Deltaproteobacteria bacterium]